MKVVWLLDELGVAYERRDAGGAFGFPDGFAAKNPWGRIPVLQDGPAALFESNAILRHVARKHPTPFWPADAGARAVADMWMDAQQATIPGPLGVVFNNLIRRSPEQRDHAAVREATAEAARVWGVVDAALAGRAYVAGDELTLADFAWGVHVHRWFALPLERPDAPRLRAWYERLLARPAYAATCAGPLT